MQRRNDRLADFAKSSGLPSVRSSVRSLFCSSVCSSGCAAVNSFVGSPDSVCVSSFVSSSLRGAAMKIENREGPKRPRRKPPSMRPRVPPGGASAQGRGAVASSPSGVSGADRASAGAVLRPASAAGGADRASAVATGASATAAGRGGAAGQALAADRPGSQIRGSATARDGAGASDAERLAEKLSSLLQLVQSAAPGASLSVGAGSDATLLRVREPGGSEAEVALTPQDRAELERSVDYLLSLLQTGSRVRIQADKG